MKIKHFIIRLIKNTKIFFFFLSVTLKVDLCFKPSCFLVNITGVNDLEAERVVLSKRECKKGSWDNSRLILRTKYVSLRLLGLTSAFLEG